MTSKIAIKHHHLLIKSPNQKEVARVHVDFSVSAAFRMQDYICLILSNFRHVFVECMLHSTKMINTLEQRGK